MTVPLERVWFKEGLLFCALAHLFYGVPIHEFPNALTNEVNFFFESEVAGVQHV
jgi:hypothetical protein